jgi:dihydroorotase (multifunctional complex type)
MYDLLIRGARLATSAGEPQADVAVRDGRIVAIAAAGELASGQRTIEADGLHLLPGLVDPHVHLREPGFTDKEDFRSGTMAAAAGGVTTVMAIPNTNPPLTTVEAFQEAARLASEKSVVDVALFGAACIADPAPIPALARAGAIGFDMYDDPHPYGTEHWIQLVRQVEESGLPLGFYQNDSALQAYNRSELAARGASAVERFVGGVTGTAEVLGMARILPLAARFDVPVVLRSATTPEGLEFVRQMRRCYPTARIAVETCVHYLFVTVDDLASMGTRAQMMPPPRNATEVAALWRAVLDGTVTYVGTDHAPHEPTKKDATDDLFQAPPGIIGLETLLPLLLNARAEGRLQLTDIVRLCCEQPARTYGIYPRKGAIAVGADADLVLADLTERWRIDASRFYSRGHRGPFDDWEITGRPRLTLVRGRVVMEDGVVDETAWGALITPRGGDA